MTLLEMQQPLARIMEMALPHSNLELQLARRVCKYAVMWMMFHVIGGASAATVIKNRDSIAIYIYIYTVEVKLKFPFTVCLSTVYRLNGNIFSCVFSVHTTDKLNMCSVISTS